MIMEMINTNTDDGILCVIIKADASVEVKRVDGSLEAYQQIVGGYIEPVDFTWNGRRMSAYVNEEGLIHQLPINPLLCAIVGHPVLCGDAVIVGAPDKDGETTDVCTAFAANMGTLESAIRARLVEKVVL
tara:strand:- start:85 stop:474 length:390 start_codon:yes stop_codon:yes gene_type:complete